MDSTWFLVLAVLAMGAQGLLLVLALFEPGLAYKLSNPVSDSTDSEEFLCVIEALADAKAHSCTTTHVFTNGEQYYAAELRDIEAAQSSIHLEAYIFERGRVGKQFVDALTARARAGVEVRLVIDSIGSFTTWNGFFDELRKAGGRVGWYHGFKWHLLPRLNNRTHRELLIVDGKIGYIGGSGWADHWMYPSRKHPRWRDTMVRVEGDAVVAMQATFVENWLEASGEMLVGSKYFPHDTSGREDAELLVVNSSPSAGGSTRARMLFQAIIASARRSIYINSPYFLPDRSARAELIRAAKRGVDVRVITPGHRSDHLLTRHSSRRLYGPLLEGGVRIFEYMPAMIHHKCLIVDGTWSVVGSTNFDPRSFGLNDEVNMAARDRELAKRLTDDYVLDLRESEEITLDEWKRRNVFERLHEWVGWVLERQQ